MTEEFLVSWFQEVVEDENWYKARKFNNELGNKEMKVGLFHYSTAVSGKERNVWLMSAHAIICVRSFPCKGHS